ncbi:MAG: LysR family transcriptional regulator [Pseudomonadota bacterium]
MALLVSLDALLQERSVTGAARRLGISQPAMSSQLQKLRDLFGDPVLVADGNRMVPTARFLALERPLRSRLAALHELVFQSEKFDPGTAKRTFRIAATDYAHSVVIPVLLDTLRREAPGIRISALPFAEQNHRERLGDDFDCAIASERMIDHTVPSRQLFEDDFVFVHRKNHPRIKGPVDLDLFCALDHLLVSPSGGGFTGAVDSALAALGRSRVVVASLPIFLLAPAVLRRSDCVAVLPSRVAQLDTAGLVITPSPISVGTFPTILGWHSRLSRDPGHTWLRKTIAVLSGSARR